jgi:hypothetical protein
MLDCSMDRRRLCNRGRTRRRERDRRDTRTHACPPTPTHTHTYTQHTHNNIVFDFETEHETHCSLVRHTARKLPRSAKSRPVPASLSSINLSLCQRHLVLPTDSRTTFCLPRQPALAVTDVSCQLVCGAAMVLLSAKSAPERPWHYQLDIVYHHIYTWPWPSVNSSSGKHNCMIM